MVWACILPWHKWCHRRVITSNAVKFSQTLKNISKIIMNSWNFTVFTAVNRSELSFSLRNGLLLVPSFRRISSALWNRFIFMIRSEHFMIAFYALGPPIFLQLWGVSNCIVFIETQHNVLITTSYLVSELVQQRPSDSTTPPWLKRLAEPKPTDELTLRDRLLSAP